MLREHVKKLKAYSVEQPAHRIKLNQNESPYDLPAELKNKVIEKIRDLNWNRYASPFADSLRRAIAKKEDWDPEGVLLQNGSNSLINIIVTATAIRGKLMTVAPSFSLYAMEGKIFENRVIEIPLDPEDFSLPLKSFLQKLKKEKPSVVFLANPNAPTGNLFPEEELLQIVKARKETIVVVDEAYYPFSKKTMRPHLKDYENLVILRTFSKAFSAAGIRLGYLLAAPSLARELRKVMRPFCINLFQEAVGQVMLDHPGYVSDVVNQIVREREMLFNELKKIPGTISYPSQANYILFRVANASKTYTSLLDQGVLVRPMHGKGIENCLRVTIGTPEENRLFLQALSKP
ncbi:MAG: histidinol-phosphate transaminase [Deltaproteobacteria bacterium]|nr:histidinol-phosphate transaminase [Deltaproteobacteria bacterium]